MNSEQRKALVEELAEALYVFDELSVNGYGMDRWINADHTLKDVYRSRAHHKIMPIIDRLFADRAVPTAEPGAEATVERVGTAILREVDVNNGDPPSELGDQFPENQKLYRDMARAAIAAMPSGADADDEPWLGPRDKGVTVKATVVEADDAPMFPDLGADADNWLDDDLDSVHPETYVSYVLWESGSQGSWRACIRWPDSHMSARWGYPHRDSIGHGTTRREAIMDAVANARKEASNE